MGSGSRALDPLEVRELGEGRAERRARVPMGVYPPPARVRARVRRGCVPCLACLVRCLVRSVRVVRSVRAKPGMACVRGVRSVAPCLW